MHANDTALVHIIDDDVSLRRALERALRSVGLQARGYGSVREFVNAERPDAPGCLILDVRLPGINGLEFQRQLVDLDILLPAILMTGHGDIPMTVRAMKAGAVDFLPKPFREQDMLDAVETAIGRDRRRRAMSCETTQIRQSFEKLSAREQQILFLVTAGKLNKQIAWELGISEITVKVHRGSAMKKMNARSIAELVRMADLLRS